MANYSDPEIELDSALASRAKADRLVARFGAGEGSGAIMVYAAQSDALRDPNVLDQSFANAAHLVRISARPGLVP